MEYVRVIAGCVNVHGFTGCTRHWRASAYTAGTKTRVPLRISYVRRSEIHVENRVKDMKRYAAIGERCAVQTNK